MGLYRIRKFLQTGILLLLSFLICLNIVLAVPCAFAGSATAASGGCHYNEDPAYTERFLIFDLQSAPVPESRQLHSWEHSIAPDFLVDSRTFKERRLNIDPGDSAVYWVFYVDPSKSWELPTSADNRIVSFTPSFANGVTGTDFIKADCFDTEPEYRVIKTDGEALLTGVDATFAYQADGNLYDNILNPDYSHLRPSILLWAVYGPPVPIGDYLAASDLIPSAVDKDYEAAAENPESEAFPGELPDDSPSAATGINIETKVLFVLLATVIVGGGLIVIKSRHK